MNSTIQCNVIVGCDVDDGIAKDGKIPWYCKSDLSYFKNVTSHTSSPDKVNAVVMGRKTWESLPAKYRPLPNRLNVILSKSTYNNPTQSTVWISSFNQLQQAISSYPVESIWFIGGESVYAQALDLFPITFVYKTVIHKKFNCDQHFLTIPRNYQMRKSSQCVESDGTIVTFEIYKRLDSGISAVGSPYTMNTASENRDEQQYLSLIETILQRGTKREDRTGVGTISLFGTQMRFDIRSSIPLLTTKRVFFRGVVEELLWFLRGDTNVQILQDKNVNIWNGNASPEYLESIGLSHLKNGDLGPIYGFQWRHFGADYVKGDTDYTGCGVDQIARVLHQIKHEPHSRRIILSAWNPVDVDKMALPPCHVLYQFYVNKGELSCHMYQRSGDVGLGVPFNIASTSVLTYILAHLTGLQPGDVVHSMGDAHIYRNHVDALLKQCERTPRPFPTLTINPNAKSIEELQYSDFTLHNYRPHASIKMEMAV